MAPHSAGARRRAGRPAARTAEQREELERLEIELVDLETTISRRWAGSGGGRAAVSITVLFVCFGNFGRQPDGRGAARRFGGEAFRPLSGGTGQEGPSADGPGPGRAGHRLGAARAKSVTELLDQPLDYVITLNSAREACPAFPGIPQPLHWHLEGPGRGGGGARKSASTPSGPPGRSSRCGSAHSSRSRAAPWGLPAGRHAPQPGKEVDHRASLPRAPHAPGAGRAGHPEPPRRGEAGGEPCGVVRGRRHRRRLVGRAFHPPPAGGRQPARNGLAGEPRTSTRSRTCRRTRPRPSRRSPAASSARSCRSATSVACTCTAGATAAPTSTSGSCHAR